MNEFIVYESIIGTDALNFVEEKVLDFIICDIMMPHMDGFEFIQIDE